MIIDKKTTISLDTPIDLEYEAPVSTFLQNISKNKQNLDNAKPKLAKIREIPSTSNAKKSNTKSLF